MTAALCLLLCFGFSDPEFLVIAHPSTQIESLNMRELRALYLKKIDRLAGEHLTPIQFPSDHPLQAVFELFLFGERFDLAQYWYEQQLKAGPKPPSAVNDEAFLLIYVARNPGYLGFLPVHRAEEARRFGVKVLQIKD